MRLVDENYEADKAVEKMMDRKDYMLVVRCQHTPSHFLYIPLPIEGDKSDEAALAWMKNALIVARHTMKDHHGRSAVNMNRADGVPSEEQEKMGGLHGFNLGNGHAVQS